MSRVFSEIIRNNRGFVEIVSFTEKISRQNGFFHQKENETQKNQEPPEQLLTIKSKSPDLSAKRTFEIYFLTKLCRVKKHFYLSKCANCQRS